MSFDISVYGHLTIDTIFDNDKIYEFGGIANVWRAFKEMRSNYLIDINPVHYGEALIYIDKENSKRYSDAKLNIKTFNPKIKNSKLSVILYLNELENTSFIKNLKSFNIADICKGKPIKDTDLTNIDLLVCSDEDIDSYSEIPENFSGITLIHHEFGSELFLNNLYSKFHLEDDLKLNNINVLGAGDIFISYLSIMLLQDKTFELQTKIEQFNSIKQFLGGVHINTSKHLQKIR
jgi:sugar/nucleoside kinase (ribokinase family)